jgi:hypothetical protein
MIRYRTSMRMKKQQKLAEKVKNLMARYRNPLSRTFDVFYALLVKQGNGQLIFIYKKQRNLPTRRDLTLCPMLSCYGSD